MVGLQGRVSVRSMALEHVAKVKKTDPSAMDTHEITSLESLMLVVAGLDSDGGRSWEPVTLLWRGE